MFNALLPKGAPFFALLLQQNMILCKVAGDLVETLENPELFDDAHRRILAQEEEADILHQVIIRHLSQTFITPIDREDILHINKMQEEAIDQFANMANRLHIFEFPTIRFPMLRLANTAKDMVGLIRAMLRGLAKKRDCHNTRKFRALRGDCEMLLSVGLAELHDLREPTPENLLTILKWGQAYDRMELVVEELVELAETIEEAVLKNV